MSERFSVITSVASFPANVRVKPDVSFSLLLPNVIGPPSMRMPPAEKVRAVSFAISHVPPPRFTATPPEPVKPFCMVSFAPDGMYNGTSPVPDMAKFAYQVVFMHSTTPTPPAATVTVPWLMVLFWLFV